MTGSVGVRVRSEGRLDAEPAEADVAGFLSALQRDLHDDCFRASYAVMFPVPTETLITAARASTWVDASTCSWCEICLLS